MFVPVAMRQPSIGICVIYLIQILLIILRSHQDALPSPLLFESDIYNSTFLSSWALKATIIVESDIRAAPTAGDSTKPAKANAPAAAGTAEDCDPPRGWRKTQPSDRTAGSSDVP